MSVAIFPTVFAAPYREGFQHATARVEMGGGRSVTTALYSSAGLFRAAGTLRFPERSTPCTVATFLSFVAARRGGYDSFLFLPAMDQHGKSTSEAVGTGDGSTTLFALDFKYPKSTTLTVTKNGSPQTQGADYSLADSAGNSWSLGEVPYLKFAVAPTAGHAIVATYRYYIPVRFEDDEIGASLGALHLASSDADGCFVAGEASIRQDTPGSHLSVPTAP